MPRAPTHSSQDPTWSSLRALGWLGCGCWISCGACPQRPFPISGAGSRPNANWVAMSALVCACERVCDDSPPCSCQQAPEFFHVFLSPQPPPPRRTGRRRRHIWHRAGEAWSQSSQNAGQTARRRTHWSTCCSRRTLRTSRRAARCGKGRCIVCVFADDVGVVCGQGAWRKGRFSVRVCVCEPPPTL